MTRMHLGTRKTQKWWNARIAVVLDVTSVTTLARLNSMRTPGGHEMRLGARIATGGDKTDD